MVCAWALWAPWAPWCAWLVRGHLGARGWCAWAPPRPRPRAARDAAGPHTAPPPHRRPSRCV
eukprot:1459024-Prymnesium_polylepis.1